MIVHLVYKQTGQEASWVAFATLSEKLADKAMDKIRAHGARVFVREMNLIESEEQL